MAHSSDEAGFALATQQPILRLNENFVRELAWRARSGAAAPTCSSSSSSSSATATATSCVRLNHCQRRSHLSLSRCLVRQTIGIRRRRCWLWRMWVVRRLRWMDRGWSRMGRWGPVMVVVGLGLLRSWLIQREGGGWLWVVVLLLEMHPGLGLRFLVMGCLWGNLIYPSRSCSRGSRTPLCDRGHARRGIHLLVSVPLSEFVTDWPLFIHQAWPSKTWLVAVTSHAQRRSKVDSVYGLRTCTNSYNQLQALVRSC